MVLRGPARVWVTCARASTPHAVVRCAAAATLARTFLAKVEPTSAMSRKAKQMKGEQPTDSSFP